MILQRRVMGYGGLPTLGHLVSRDGQFQCETLERSVDGDHPCIPAGVYTVHEATHHPDSPHHYQCPELDTSKLVPVRTHIQIHVANRVSELLGCIAPGERVASDGLAVESSGDAFARMMAHINGHFPFTLEIRDMP